MKGLEIPCICEFLSTKKNVAKLKKLLRRTGTETNVECTETNNNNQANSFSVPQFIPGHDILLLLYHIDEIRDN